MATPTSQQGRGRIPAPAAEDDAPVRIVSDIRAGAPFLLTRAQLLVAARRLASITALVCIDLGGLVLGLYAALVARELYYGRDAVLWGVLWRVETDWLPFLTLDHGARLLAGAPLRGARAATRLRAHPVVADPRRADHARLRDRHGPPLLDLRARADGRAALRGHDRCTARELRARHGRSAATARACAGTRCSPARARTSPTCTRALGSGRSGIDYEFVGALAPSADGVGLPVLGRRAATCPRVLDRERVDELIVTDSDFGERELLEIVEHAHRRGVEVRIAPKATELLTQRVEFVPGQGMPLFELRPPAFVGHGLGRQARLRPGRRQGSCWSSGCRSGSGSPPRSSSARAARSSTATAGSAWASRSSGC